MKKIYMILFALMAVLNASATDFYLTGAFNEWNVKSDACKFTETSTSGVYTLNYSGTLTSGFKITDGAWNSTYDIGSSSDSNVLTVGTAFTYQNGGGSVNINFEDVTWSVENPTLTLNTTEGTLLIEGTVVKPTTITYTYGLNGSFEDGENWAETTMTDAGDGVFTATAIEVKAAAKFGINAYANGTWSAWWYGPADVSITGDTEITMVSSGGNNISIAAGTYDFSFDTTTNKLTVKKSTASAISSVAAESEADAPAYNLAGQRVAKGAKGLVIVNGKKLFNK